MTENELQKALAGPVTSLIRAICVNAWYSAMNLYIAEGGSLTQEKKQEIWEEVCSQVESAQLSAEERE